MDYDVPGGVLCCPQCGEIQESFEVFVHGGGCMACGAEIADEDWITD